MKRPIPGPEQRLPAYESLPIMVRRIIREELTPVLEEIEALRGLLAASSATPREVTTRL